MRGKILLLGLGIAAGYLFGTESGRAKLAALRAKADELLGDPRIDAARRDVVDYTRQQAPVIRERAERFAKEAPAAVAQTARDVAGNVAETARDVAGTVAETARDVAGTVASTAKDVAGNVAGTAKRVAGDLRERGEDFIAGATRSAGEARDAMLEDDPDRP